VPVPVEDLELSDLEKSSYTVSVFAQTAARRGELGFDHAGDLCLYGRSGWSSAHKIRSRSRFVEIRPNTDPRKPWVYTIDPAIELKGEDVYLRCLFGNALRTLYGPEALEGAERIIDDKPLTCHRIRKVLRRVDEDRRGFRTRFFLETPSGEGPPMRGTFDALMADLEAEALPPAGLKQEAARAALKDLARSIIDGGKRKMTSEERWRDVKEGLQTFLAQRKTVFRCAPWSRAAENSLVLYDLHTLFDRLFLMDRSLLLLDPLKRWECMQATLQRYKEFLTQKNAVEIQGEARRSALQSLLVQGALQVGLDAPLGDAPRVPAEEVEQIGLRESSVPVITDQPDETPLQQGEELLAEIRRLFGQNFFRKRRLPFVIQAQNSGDRGQTAKLESLQVALHRRRFMALGSRSVHRNDRWDTGLAPLQNFDSLVTELGEKGLCPVFYWREQEKFRRVLKGLAEGIVQRMVGIERYREGCKIVRDEMCAFLKERDEAVRHLVRAFSACDVPMQDYAPFVLTFENLLVNPSIAFHEPQRERPRLIAFVSRRFAAFIGGIHEQRLLEMSGMARLCGREGASTIDRGGGQIQELSSLPLDERTSTGAGRVDLEAMIRFMFNRPMPPARFEVSGDDIRMYFEQGKIPGWRSPLFAEQEIQ